MVGPIGRDDEVLALEEHLAPGGAVAVVSGIGGIGKSTVSRAVVTRAMRGGRTVFRCLLDDATSADALVDRLGVELGLTADALNFDKRVLQIGRTLRRQISPLVALEGFEAVVDAGVEIVARWRDLAPTASFLITSRERIHLPDMLHLPLEPLSCEPSAEGASPAARLFIERAQRARPLTVDDETLRSIEAIVARLDGVPLAIELAAGRLAVLSVQQLQEHLERGLGVLATTLRSVPERHRGMARVIEWSWACLPAWARDGMGQLLAFRGHFCAEDAEQVVQLDGVLAVDVLQCLAEASLLTDAVRGPDGLLYHRLLEPVRDFVGERVDPASLDTARRRHARYFLDVIQPDDLLAVLDLTPEWISRIVDRSVEYQAIRESSPDLRTRLRAQLRLLRAPTVRDAALRVLAELDAVDISELGGSEAAAAELRTCLAIECVRASAAIFGSRPGLVEAALRSARHLAGRLDADDGWLLVEYLTGLFASQAGDFRLAEHHFRKAWALALDDDRPMYRCSIAQNLAPICADPDDRRRFGRRATRELPPTSVTHLVAMSALALALDGPDEAEERLALARASAEGLAKCRWLSMEIHALIRLGSIQHASGHLADATETLRAAREKLVPDVQPTVAGFCGFYLGLTRLEAQDYRRAGELFAEVAAMLEDSGVGLGCRWCRVLTVGELEPSPYPADELAALRRVLGRQGQHPMADLLELWTSIIWPEHAAVCPPRLGPDDLDDTRNQPFVVALRRSVRVAWQRRHPPADALLIAPDAIRLPGGQVIRTRRRGVVHRLAGRLLDQRLLAPGRVCSSRWLIEQVWPEEARPDSPSSRNRLHVTLHRVRSGGLGPWVEATGDGWRITPDLHVLRVFALA